MSVSRLLKRIRTIECAMISRDRGGSVPVCRKSSIDDSIATGSPGCEKTTRPEVRIASVPSCPLGFFQTTKSSCSKRGR